VESPTQQSAILRAFAACITRFRLVMAPVGTRAQTIVVGQMPPFSGTFASTGLGIAQVAPDPAN